MAIMIPASGQPRFGPLVAIHNRILQGDHVPLRSIMPCRGAFVALVSDIKYLSSSKVFLLSIERTKIEGGQNNKKINSICRFDFVDNVKSKNINQKNDKLIIELIAIDYMKNNDNYEINLIFKDNAHIVLTTESIEVRLEDQNEIKEK